MNVVKRGCNRMRQLHSIAPFIPGESDPEPDDDEDDDGNGTMPESGVEI